MNNDVKINKTDTKDNNTTVYFTIPKLNIDSQLKLANDEFENQMTVGGFKQLGYYLVEQLESGLSNMLMDNQVVSQTKIKDININE